MSTLNEPAPSFELKNTNKELVSLESYKGKTVVLAFYPGAFTGVCDTEMCAFNDQMSKLTLREWTIKLYVEDQASI